MQRKRILRFVVALAFAAGIVLGVARPGYAAVPDSDGDGVDDISDHCPLVPGPAANNGCPYDRDGDGVPDSSDNCPDTPGPAAKNGCPRVHNPHRQIVRGSDEAGVLTRQSWELTYPAGLCAERCALNANNLPRGARLALKGMPGLVSKAYFQTYGLGTYQVCYYGSANALYQFLGGEWMLIGRGGEGVVCANANGDGAFAAFIE